MFECDWCGNLHHWLTMELFGRSLVCKDCERKWKEEKHKLKEENEKKQELMIKENLKLSENEWGISRVNMIIDHEDMDFIAYEFEVENEIIIEESGCEQWLFRLDVDKKTGDIEVYCAYSADFDIMEEATCYFETEKTLADIKSWIEDRKGTENEVGNQGEIYIKYLQYREKGYECDDAVCMAYGN